jgi:NAD(P)-dependent dehydrogenase (short-subunit alcohol dehydrogenase family)
MQDFEGKVAVVTGGASGIGLAMATRFAQEGMKIVLGDIEEAALETAVARLRQQEFEVHGVLTDVANAASVENLARETIERFGKVHVVCNNAGVGGSRAARIWDATLDDWNWAMGVNTWGVIYGIHSFVPIMLAQGEEGHIVNTASVAGLVQGNRVYSVTKHAVVALSEALYDGLMLEGARVSASVLCPGLYFTNLSAAERNRPDSLSEKPDETRTMASDPAIAERARQLRDTIGRQPDDLAERVLQAIKNNQFYIITHDDYDGVIRERMENILTRRNPEPKGPGLTWVGTRTDGPHD